ncbi:pur operon repressor [Apilactobacillus micheneri]|uniref:Pur operon repressor n=1 Tax=Apilactobacillus micheneri TaxID=1899430 RepID=A0A2S2JLR0_9LACO|nr:pur operon repressor [Apilactobacillus micheneri]TPR34521.1 pur operon repressor [Apilactobacillus micheneri]TPR38042.1 pur operon repressor [Apilactobacillus micheneri]TPR38793.1 pur operon repressor [Apilactobacillus micheneri]TPR41327.1 pur operon repressor [Apilactobacillus micheneri]TPR43021.1 pur operon repressor [Apilactobacillus micheneri]
MKAKRSTRLVDMTRFLMENPNTVVPLTFFAHRYESAKSSISEDLTILRKTFQESGTGILETIPGAAGGSKFIPSIEKDEAVRFIEELQSFLDDNTRMLPGGYVYMNDLLNRPSILRQIGRLIATMYKNKKIDAVLTVATKGIPVAQSVATLLNVPFIIARHDSRITDGSTISVNYVSGSQRRIEKMVLSKRSLPANSNVLIVDDFLRGGGSAAGLCSLINEFDSKVAGISFVAERDYDGERKISSDQYTSLFKIDTNSDEIKVSQGNFDWKPFDNFSKKGN